MKLRPMVKAIAVVLSVAAVPNLFAQPSPAPAAPAAPTVARLVLIEGDALASTETGLVAVTKGAAFANGTRVMTMAKSKGTIEYADGCIIELEPNMRVEIRLGIPCVQRQNLAVQTVLDPATELALEGALETPTASIPALVLGGALGGPAGAVAGVAGITAIVGNNPTDSVSPN
ncbi:MAG: hypothetical protein NDI88_16245 [Lysobacter sp.]|nr:hypothetical protein [Lysobacter sp.]